ncbi:beta-lactamase family protein [Streptosporangium sp. NBC_01639]|uniref:serine hydrolase domain-containing protein n=1 Tax=Streptosporangium sp. NBC_01639 TaxID=2975948 RepID=UPI0038705B29|nr:beta-lactamase family protein [Streptosporangium sp. NBC_01639]
MIRTFSRKPAVLLAVASLAAGPAAVANADVRAESPQAEVKVLLDGLVRAGAATAASVRLREREQDWAAAAGVRDLKSRRPADADGYFRIGSVTKTFVATVVLQLSDERRLRLDDPVERHLPGVVPNGGRITVRQVLNHTSGLHDYMSEPGYSTNRWRGVDRFRDYTPAHLLKVAFSRPPDFKPGEKWRYSNTNYIVAGLLVEKLTGRPYGEEIGRRVLRPLHLTQTIVPGTRPGLPGPHAHGYTTLSTGQVVDATRMDPSLDWAAGEMISTTRDLTVFFDALLAGKLTSARSLDAMRATVATGVGFRYGLGLQEYALPCGRSLWGHSGELLGYMTFAFRSDDGRRLAMSVNPGTRKPSQQEMFAIAGTFHCKG